MRQAVRGRGGILAAQERGLSPNGGGHGAPGLLLQTLPQAADEPGATERARELQAAPAAAAIPPGETTAAAAAAAVEFAAATLPSTAAAATTVIDGILRTRADNTAPTKRVVPPVMGDAVFLF